MKNDSKKINEIRYVDLFAGLGGFRSALEQFCKDHNNKCKCVFVSEINQNVIQTYIKNFGGNASHFINIKDVDDKCTNVPSHDFLFAGFPCQTFSNAGKKRGFLDEVRGTLFFEIAKILKTKKPKYALLENVKHIVNHNNGQTWNTITSKLKELGYLMPKDPLFLNPVDFGIPQDRCRVFIPLIHKDKIKNKNIKHLEFDFKNEQHNLRKRKNAKEVRNYIFKQYIEKRVDDKYYLCNDKKNGDYLLKVFDAWNEFLKNVKRPNNKVLPVIWLDYLNQKIDTSNMPKWKVKYLESMWEIYDLNKNFIKKWMKKWRCDKWKKREKKFEWQAGNEINDIRDTFIQLRQSGIRCRKPLSFPTLVAMVQIPIIFDINKKWRYLTPRETANLQSFPKDYLLYNDIIKDSPNADFYTYMQIGNSVNVKIVKLILEKMMEYE